MTDGADLAEIASPARAEALLNANPELAIRMERLDVLRDASWRAMDAAWGRLNEAREAKQRAERLLAELLDYDQRKQLVTRKEVGDFDPQTGRRAVETGRDEAALTAAEQAVESAASRMARAKESHQSATEVWNAAKAVHSRCERYVLGLSRYRPVAAKAAARKGETWPDAVARVRADIAETAALISNTAAAPLPADEVRELIRLNVRRLGERAAPIIGREGVRWSPMLVSGISMTDCLGLIARMFPEQLAAQAEAEINHAEGALTEQQKLARLSELADRLLVLGRDEEALIRGAEAGGIDIARRGDSDPRAVLAIEGPAPRD